MFAICLMKMNLNGSLICQKQLQIHFQWSIDPLSCSFHVTEDELVFMFTVRSMSVCVIIIITVHVCVQ